MRAESSISTLLPGSHSTEESIWLPHPPLLPWGGCVLEKGKLPSNFSWAGHPLIQFTCVAATITFYATNLFSRKSLAQEFPLGGAGSDSIAALRSCISTCV